MSVHCTIFDGIKTTPSQDESMLGYRVQVIWDITNHKLMIGAMFWSMKMATHGNHDSLLDYDDHIVTSREMEDRPVTVINKSTRRGTNEDGEVNEATLRKENADHESDRADNDMQIGDCVDVSIKTLIARAYVTTERTDAYSAAV